MNQVAWALVALVVILAINLVGVIRRSRRRR